MDMTVMPVPVDCTNAYSKGGIPLKIHAIANVKISSDPAVVGNAVERFMGRDQEEIARVARETLEGNLRGVVALMTPEQVNEDRLRFADRIVHDVEKDLVKLGLQLDTLKIQSVSDEVDYLNSIGRVRIAEIIKRAEIAESDALREAETAEAAQDQTAVVAQTESKTAILEKQNELRRITAELDQTCRSEEERTEAAVLEARALSEQKLQEVRTVLERLRLKADEILPAEANRKARELLARGEASPMSQNAKAEAAVNDMMAKVWLEGGDAAAQVFLIQQIEMVLNKVLEVPARLTMDKVQVVDNGDGKSISALVNAYPDIVHEFLERVKRTFGIDVVGTLTGHTAEG
jgi:flotillin